MRVLAIISLLLSALHIHAQTAISDLEWAPVDADTMYVAAALPSGRPVWLRKDLLMVGGSGGADNQALTIVGDTLYLQRGGSVVLPPYVDTDDQQLTLVGDLLTLERSGGVDLTPYVNTDNQGLSIVGDSLRIDRGSAVGVSAFFDNTDDQQLTIDGDSLHLEAGGSITLVEYRDNTDDQQINQLMLDSAYYIHVGVEDGDTLSLDLSTLIDDADADTLNEIQELGVTNNFITATKSPPLILDAEKTVPTREHNDKIVMRGADGSLIEFVFKDITVPVTDEQQLSLIGNVLQLTNGGQVDLGLVNAAGGVDTLYGLDNTIHFTIDGTDHEIVIEACEYCAPVTISPANDLYTTENTDIETVATHTGGGTVTVVMSNPSDCSALRGLAMVSAQMKIYGHQNAEYLAYIEYRTGGGSWTVADESERELYRNVGNYEETLYLDASLPIEVAASASVSLEVRARLQVISTGTPSLFVVADSPQDAKWHDTHLRVKTLLSNNKL